MAMLRVERAKIAIDDKLVVKHAELFVNSGEVVLLLGPNGSGKSSLLNAIVGNPRYRLVEGRIVVDSTDISKLSPEERVKLGIGIAVQNPPRLRGIRFRRLLEKILSRSIRSKIEIEKEIQHLAKLLELEHLLDREFGYGFSGGELKRAEIALLIASRPRIALVDEPDSGVDVDSVLLIANALREMFDLGTEAMVVVTHSGFIAKHIVHKRAYIMLEGSTVCEGPSQEILDKVMRIGFSYFKERCP